MQIIPYTNIAINGRHCPAGAATEVADALAIELIAQRIVRRAPPAAAAAPQQENAAASPVVETAVSRTSFSSRPAAPSRKPKA